MPLKATLTSLIVPTSTSTRWGFESLNGFRIARQFSRARCSSIALRCIVTIHYCPVGRLLHGHLPVCRSRHPTRARTPPGWTRRRHRLLHTEDRLEQTEGSCCLEGCRSSDLLLPLGLLGWAHHPRQLQPLPQQLSEVRGGGDGRGGGGRGGRR